ncbi:hypothetical protein [Marinomonas transparens]|uniref:Porin n=1 Tax=Marinomonas transparens TaxID=2795388 RepID=A0A934N3T6_9GAMM|nr:hypothetical protein [Marinomonas transparens]MBJ7540022.1 hypothetical protein [Marinomonas transparens]
MLYRHIPLFIVVLVFMSGHAKADGLNIDFSGFATLNMSYSDNADVGFSSNYLNRSDTGFSLSRDSLLGGQANISMSHDWDAVVQGVYQDRSVKSFDNFLELGFVRYRPQRNWSIRAGRINSDIYLLSEYPHVGYAYLWARPPHAYYSFASTTGHYDGVDVEYNNQVGDGFLRIKLAVGETTPTLMASDEELSVTFDDLYTLSAVYLKDEWTFRAATSRSKISDFKSPPFNTLIDGLNSVPSNVWSQAAEFSHGFESQHHTINYSALGLTYDNFDWLIQTEIGTTTSDWMVAPSNISGYLSIGYRVNEVTYFGGMSVAKNKKDTTDVVTPELAYLPEQQQAAIRQLINNTEYAINRSVVDQKSFNLGAKWYYSDKVVLKVQADHFIIQPRGGALWDIDTSTDIETEHNVNLVSLSVSVVF